MVIEASGGATASGTAAAAVGNPAAIALMAIGVVNSTIGSYYGAVAERYKLRSQASSLEFEATQAGINAALAARDAQDQLGAGIDAKARTTAQYGQAIAANRARTAASGVQAGVGSAAEIDVSIEAAKEIDALTIERNALRMAQRSRLQSVDFRNRALIARTSAENLRDAARSINPTFAAITSLIGGASQVASSYLSQQQR